MANFSVLLSVTLAAIFKHGRGFLSKIVNFRKMLLTFDRIHLSTCRWAQIICIKILHLLVCTLQGFVMLITWILQTNDRKVEFRGFFPLLLTTVVLFSILKTLFSTNVHLALERRLYGIKTSYSLMDNPFNRSNFNSYLTGFYWVKIRILRFFCHEQQ